MAEKDLNIVMTTTEKQVLEHPATLRLFLSILIPCVSGFNIYVMVTGRMLASAVLWVELTGFVIVLGVMKSRLPEVKKILVYRHLLRAQILIFGLYLLLMVGVFHQKEVSFWCFLFIFLVALWMPERLGIWAVVIFNAGIVILSLVPDLTWFLDNDEFLIRFYAAQGIFSLLAMGAGRVRRRYLANLYEVRAGLEESEQNYQELNRKLMQEIELRDRIEKRLHHAIKMETLGTVAAGVAHDLNNILSGIVTYPELLLLDLEPDDPMREPLETIRSTGTKAAAIVDDLLALSRRGVAAARTVNLCQVVGEYLASPEHRQLMAEHGQVRVSMACDTDSAFVTGSSIHLAKTLMNLVRNGVEAVSGKGEVVIQVSSELIASPAPLNIQVQGEKEIPQGQYVRLMVSDTGTGIDPGEQEAVFEPFYTRKKMGRSGTGLGMALVLGTVNDHGGYIQMVSAPGKGTLISLFFPAAEEILVQESKTSGVGTLAGRGESVLVVDDEPVQLKIAEGLLSRLEYTVFSCPSGESALKFLDRNRVDLVILDIIMEPGMSGVEACEILMETHPGQKVLFVTGYSDSHTLARAGALSRGHCLFKPYTLKNMGVMVKERLNTPGKME